jgi:hypothetical protein
MTEPKALKNPLPATTCIPQGFKSPQVWEGRLPPFPDTPRFGSLGFRT